MNCSICYEDLNADTAFKVNCGHEFCRECLIPWINRRREDPTCPNCRGVIQSSEVEELSPVVEVSVTISMINVWEDESAHPFVDELYLMVMRYRGEDYSGPLPVRALHRIDPITWDALATKVSIRVRSDHFLYRTFGDKLIYWIA